MIKELIKKIVFSKKATDFFNSDNFLSNYLLTKPKVFQRKFIKTHNYQNNNKSHSTNIFSIKDLQVSGENFIFWGEIDSSIDLKLTNSVAGYVPFHKKCTQILLYNFFSKNYSIRKQLLGTIYFLKNGKKVLQSWFLLPVDCVKFLDFKDLEIDADNLVVELFHQKLPKNHGLHYGHLRFHGIYNNFSTVHSSPVENFYLKKKGNGISARRYFPKSLKKNDINYYIKLSNIFELSKIYNVKDHDLYGDYSKKTSNPLGYNLVLEKEINENKETENIRSVFHDAQITNFEHKSDYELQIIYIPTIANINATLYFTETIFDGTMNAKLHFFYKKFKEKKSIDIKIKKTDEINLLDMHGETLENVEFVILELIKNESTKVHQYVHIYYSINEKILDNVHTHCLEDKRCLGYKTKTNNAPQGLKWMHFPSQERYTSYLLLMNTENNLNFKLRILFEDYEERVIMYSRDYKNEINKIGIININLRDLFIKNSIKLNARGVIQLECKNYNIQGNLFTYGAEHQSLSVDHLTGG